MRTYPFAFLAILAVVSANPSRAAEKPRAAQANQAKKVWTNEDMDNLRARGLISIFGPEAPATTAETATTPSEPATYSSRLEDPEWYAEKAAGLQAELDKRASELREAQTNLALVKDRITQPGIAMDKSSPGITVDATLAMLDAQVREVQSQLDDLSDLARQNGIPPGVLRS
jgi:hypothetical protein